ncbi:oxygen evolving enhancer 2 of photosystem II [Dunaliella salina]|uniref:Oxygen evolving enhancer 2 of photosystem II n=1 Tax=Dunaliella salina TaxID=3046 RepID=A0ABQ7GY65_DUNSA|nr:oxygen evolving enhancer 2 of photosystem II [Dunaliella salina]|eukprot:KAF5839536.1 oxygen evolving enhancer 2 of photosystem II [Dunaliella salina]
MMLRKQACACTAAKSNAVREALPMRLFSAPQRSTSPVCNATVSADRRALLLGLVGIYQISHTAEPALASYGEGANVFGRVTNRSGFIPYAGEQFALLLPSKWNPSKEREFPNMVLRYLDNNDAANHTLVVIKPTDKASITDYGEPEDFANEVKYMLGVQAWQGETVSEGGFDKGSIASAALLGTATDKDRKGKPYYELEILSRSADGDEGGRHQLFKATVSNGNLYILKVQAGDKRWFKGTDKDCLGIIQSFTVA